MATDYQAWPLLPVEGAGAIGAGCRRAVTAALLVASGVVIGFTAAIGFSQPVQVVRRASRTAGMVAPSVAELMALSDDQGHGKAWHPPLPVKRCAWVVGKMAKKGKGLPREQQREVYEVTSADMNTFYRATSAIFWHDFVTNGWGSYDLAEIGVKATLPDGSPLQRTSTWTWISGDQHLSNFGAWKNRHGDVLYSFNDFDEAAINDFQLDVWRLCVSIYNHAISNNLGRPIAEASIMTFTSAYVATLQSYVGNEDEQLHEVTLGTATGKLAEFLAATDAKNSEHKQIAKFTEVSPDGTRRFKRDDSTKLEDVPRALEAQIREAFTAEHYGVTLSRTGWHSKAWDDDYFKVLDVAARVGSGVGSYGVGRYYVLLAGADVDDGPGKAVDDAPSEVILDVKFAPRSVSAQVLTGFDAGWYRQLFPNEAERTAEAQRHLTSYTDPFTGWVHINGSAYSVRQRSAWKASFDLGTLSSYAELAEFVTQIAEVTATSHARGSPSQAPAQFKEVIAAALGKPYAQATWGIFVAKVAANYREQVIFDYGCFKEFVETNFTRVGARRERDKQRRSLR